MRTIILLTLMLAAVTFAVQNADRVTVDVLFWRLDASLAIVIALCIAAGVLLGVLVAVPRIYRMRADQRRLRAQLAEFDGSNTAPTKTPQTKETTAQANETKFRSPQHL
jgi:lipopolysaccharide assembly protein A